jgi:hypothetical protein
MFRSYRQFGWFQRRFAATAVSFLLTFCCGVLSAAIVIVPTTRYAESGESGSNKERCEELSLNGRLDQLRRMSLENGRLVASTAIPTCRVLGHAQRPVLEPPPGHRLANGLLAPILS